jgi:hypothetical protein
LLGAGTLRSNLNGPRYRLAFLDILRFASGPAADDGDALDDERGSVGVAKQSFVRTKQKWFGSAEVEAHLRTHHPNCSPIFQRQIIERVCRRGWTRNTTIGAAVGITTENFVRHNFTEYDALLGERGLSRDEARLIVRKAINLVLDSWRGKDELSS